MTQGNYLYVQNQKKTKLKSGSGAYYTICLGRRLTALFLQLPGPTLGHCQQKLPKW